MKATTTYKRSAMLCLAAMLAACGPADNDPGPGGVTAGEAKTLDEAAEMLDSRGGPEGREGEEEGAKDAPQPPAE